MHKMRREVGSNGHENVCVYKKLLKLIYSYNQETHHQSEMSKWDLQTVLSHIYMKDNYAYPTLYVLS